MASTFLLLSRDGILNQPRDGGITHRTQLALIPESIQAVARLSKQGYTIIVVTHQPGLGKGLFDLEELGAIHQHILDAVEAQGGQIAAIFYCPHDALDPCHCRPPATGLLDVIEWEFDCNTAEAYYFYTSEEEKALVEHKGCRGIFCDTQNLPFALQAQPLLGQSL